MICRATWMNGLNTITTKGHTKAKCVAEERPCKHFLMAKKNLGGKGRTVEFI